jgi:magnesium-protoporphyrin O-methyltransferase
MHGTNRFFSKHSKKYITAFRKKGLAKEQNMLVEGISQSPLAGKSLLEIGCGVGGLHITLLQQGAKYAIGVDVAEGMLENARLLSKESGREQQTEYRLGDFVAISDDIARADITILDKVVCCYEQVDELLRKSLEKTERTFALSFPRNTFLMKYLLQIPIFFGKLLHWSFHPYWHDWDTLLRQIQDAGFTATYTNSTIAWSVYVFERK